MKRRTPNENGVVANPLKKDAELKSVKQMMMHFLRPIRSPSGPKIMAPNIMPNRAQLARVPACVGVRLQSSISAGRIAP